MSEVERTASFMLISVIPLLISLWGRPAHIHEIIHFLIARMLGDKNARIIDWKQTYTSLTGKKLWFVTLSPYLVGFLLSTFLGFRFVLPSSLLLFFLLEIILILISILGIMMSREDRKIILASKNVGFKENMLRQCFNVCLFTIHQTTTT